MDNFRLDVTSNGDIEPVLKIIFRGNKTVKFWKAETGRFLLAWSKPTRNTNDWCEAPFPMGPEDIAPFIQGWLKNTAQYSPQPSHDGDNGKGWRVYNENWGHIDYDYAVFAAIEPVWAMYGK